MFDAREHGDRTDTNTSMSDLRVAVIGLGVRAYLIRFTRRRPASARDRGPLSSLVAECSPSMCGR